MVARIGHKAQIEARHATCVDPDHRQRVPKAPIPTRHLLITTIFGACLLNHDPSSHASVETGTDLLPGMPEVENEVHKVRDGHRLGVRRLTLSTESFPAKHASST